VRANTDKAELRAKARDLKRSFVRTKLESASSKKHVRRLGGPNDGIYLPARCFSG